MTRPVPTPSILVSLSPTPLIKMWNSGFIDPTVLEGTSEDESYKELLILGTGTTNANIVRFEHDYSFAGQGGGSNFINLDLLDPTGDIEARFVRARLFDFLPENMKNTVLDNPSTDVVDFPYIPNTHLPLTAIFDRTDNFMTPGPSEPNRREAQREAEIDFMGAGIDPDPDVGGGLTELDEKILNALRVTKGGFNVWITYGVGDSFGDWCAPFSATLLRADLSFDGRGSRIIKLQFASSYRLLRNLSTVENFVGYGMPGPLAEFQTESEVLSDRFQLNFLRSRGSPLYPTLHWTRARRPELGTYENNLSIANTYIESLLTYTGTDLPRIDLHALYVQVIKRSLAAVTGFDENNIIVFLPDISSLLRNYITTCFLAQLGNLTGLKELLKETDWENKIDPMALILRDTVDMFFTTLGMDLARVELEGDIILSLIHISEPTRPY